MYNVTGQLQELKDLKRPLAMVKGSVHHIEFTEASLLQSLATHLTFTYGFPYIRLSEWKATYLHQAQQSPSLNVNEIRLRD